MGGLSIWHWLVVVLVIAILVAAFIWPLVLILRKAGLSRWWAALCILGYIGFPIVLWIIALNQWNPPGPRHQDVFS